MIQNIKPITMQQTPIEKASNEIEIQLNAKYANSDMHKGYKAGLQFALSVLNDWKSYEKQYLRDVAEKAWDACQKWNDFIDDDGTLGEIIHNKMPFDREDFIKKQLKL